MLRHQATKENDSKLRQTEDPCSGSKFCEILSEYQNMATVKRRQTVKSSLSSSNSSLGLSDVAYEIGARGGSNLEAKLSGGDLVDQNNNISHGAYAEAQINYEIESSKQHEFVVGNCLSELVKTVAQQVDSEPRQRQSTANHFGSFKLHEAILARATASSSSSDEDGEPASSASDSPSARSDFVGKFQVNLERWDETSASKHAHFILELAKQFHQERTVEGGGGHFLGVGLMRGSRAIEWHAAEGRSQSVDLDLVLDCLFCTAKEANILVWIARRARMAASLDLDDIALALNEPVGSGRPTLEVFVWACASAKEALHLQRAWKRQRQQRLDEAAPVPNTPRGFSTVRESVAGTASVALAGESKVIPAGPAAPSGSQKSGLFVLPLDQRGPSSQIAEEQGCNGLERGAPAVSTVPTGGREHQAELRKRQLYETISKSSSLAKMALTAPSGSQPNISAGSESQQAVSPGWRNVASKVLSSSSDKIRNLRDEMLAGRQTLASAARDQAKRLSQAINGHASTQTAESFAEAKAPTVRPRQSILRQQQQLDHQQQRQPALKRSATIRENLSELRKNSAPSAGERRSIAVQAATESEVEVAEENEIAERAAFNRLKQQRASCCDLSRLVKRELENEQSAKRVLSRDDLTVASNRSGDPVASSAISRSRQRRPPMLLDDAQEAIGARTISAAEDGTVRAQVGASHLRRAVRLKDDEDRRRSMAPSCQKSEFDPRSLRRVPRDIALSLKELGKGAECARRDERIKLEDEPTPRLSADRQAPSMAYKTTNSGTLSLIRQSLNQKSLATMLRASMRAKPSNQRGAQVEGTTAPNSQAHELDSSAARASRAEAIREAEANLQAAKQLKQQAQRLKEQQKRVEHQQASIDSAAARLFQAQQQQQQLFLSQQLQQQVYDSIGAYQQQQQQIPIQRQYQQMAFMSHHQQSGHFFAANHHHHQQLAAAAMAAPQILCLSPAYPNSNIMAPLWYPQLSHEAQAPPQQQHLVPMSVNHHSSFNIVYSPTASRPPVATNPFQVHQVIAHQRPPILPVNHFQQTKHSTLGASVRKTVRSLWSKTAQTKHLQQQPTRHDDFEQPLKGVLRTSSSQRTSTGMGSDGEPVGAASSSSSSDSSQLNISKTSSSPLDRTQSASLSPASSLSSDLDRRSTPVNSVLSPASSDSTICSVKPLQHRTDKPQEPPTIQRKNVTFSTKLTSIL